MDTTVQSKTGASIQLPEERWRHITSEHNELAGMRSQVLATIADPDRILQGNQRELLAVQEIETGKWMVVVYRELGDDGFVITAFFTRRENWFGKRMLVWSR